MSLDSELLEAARKGDVRKVRELLDRGANVNARDEYGWTPLHLAAYRGYAEVARLLLDRGANVDARDDVGDTPLHWAAHDGHLDVVELLLEHGADVNARAKDGATPLHAAAVNGRVDVVELLLEWGADASVMDKGGLTPADLARRGGFEGVAEFIDSWAKRGGGAGQAARKQVEGAERVVRGTRSRVEVLGVDKGLLKVGEWGVLKVVLKGVGSVKLSVDGDLDWMCEDSYSVDGEAVVEVYVKPKASGTIPVKIVAECSGVKSSKLFLLNVEKNVCPNCGAPVEPGAKYCWKCGAKLV